MEAQIDVLIVEDNLIDQKLISTYLKENDISFKFANDGEMAKNMLKTRSFLLILLDIELPKIDGFELTRIIREELRLETPIVAITAYSINSVKEKCFAMGMNGCFSKPIGKIELIGMLTQFLPREKLISGNSMAFNVIDLSYLKDISLGDVDFEIEIIEKFIETIDRDLLELQQNFASKDEERIKVVAHRTLSTIYIVGLKPKLEPVLRSFENIAISDMETRLDFIYDICNKAKIEAEQFVKELKHKTI